MRSIIASFVVLSIFVAFINAQATTTSLSVCVNNANYCLYCTSSTTCGACAYGYVQSSSSAYLCVSCASSISACASSLSQQCTSMGYQTVGSTCVLCASSTAANCSSTCLQNGYYNSGNSTVLGCAASNGPRVAGQVNGLVSFQSCNQFQVFSNPLGTGQVSCQYCFQSGNNVGVYNCSSLTTALSCLAGFQLTAAGQCVACSSSTSTACQVTCISTGFWTGAPTSTTSNCTSCLSTTTACQSTCTSFGFYTNGTTCSACPLGAQVCALATGSTSVVLASLCQAAYYLNTAGQCLLCPQGQMNCVAQLAYPTQCAPQYYINSTSTTCMACSGLAQTCPSTCLTQGFYTLTVTSGSTTTNTCTNCNSGTTIIATGCTYVTASSQVSHTGCQPGYYLSVSSSIATCTICSSGTASSTAGNTCASSGFYYQYGSTGTTFTNCNSTWGTSQNQGVATCNAMGALSCVNGYYLQYSDYVSMGGSSTSFITLPGGTSKTQYGLFCVACAGNIVTGSTANNFDQCSSGGLPSYTSATSNGCPTSYYYQPLNNTCMQCGNTFTATCTAGATSTTAPTSTACITGYYLNTNTVCSACSSAPQANCATGTCSNFYYITATSTCTACPSQATSCTYSASSTTISLTVVCGSGYYQVTGTASTSSGVTSTINSCSSCPTGATACTYTSSVLTSVTCGNGYYYGQGSAFLTCVVCTGNSINCFVQPVISACSSGFYNNIQACVACTNGGSAAGTAVSGATGSGYAMTCLSAGVGGTFGSDLTCYPGYYVATSGTFNGNCVSCGYTISTTSTAGVTTYNGCGSGCITAGFYLTSTNQCISCGVTALSNTALATTASTAANILTTNTLGTSPGLFNNQASAATPSSLYLAGISTCSLVPALCLAGYYVNPLLGTCVACSATTLSGTNYGCVNPSGTIISAGSNTIVATYVQSALIATLKGPTQFALQGPATYVQSTTGSMTSCGSGVANCFIAASNAGTTLSGTNTGIWCTSSYYPWWSTTYSCLPNSAVTNVILVTDTLASSGASAAITLSNPVCSTGYGYNSAATTPSLQCISCGTTTNVQTASATLVNPGVGYGAQATYYSLKSCVMNAGALSQLNCLNGYYVTWSGFYSTYAAALAASVTITCAACPGGTTATYSCIGGTAGFGSVASVVCNSGYVQQGQAGTNSLTSTITCVLSSSVTQAILTALTQSAANCGPYYGLGFWSGTACLLCSSTAVCAGSGTCSVNCAFAINPAAAANAAMASLTSLSSTGVQVASTTGVQYVVSSAAVITGIACQYGFFPQITTWASTAIYTLGCTACPANALQCTTVYTLTAGSPTQASNALTLSSTGVVCNTGYGITTTTSTATGGTTPAAVQTCIACASSNTLSNMQTAYVSTTGASSGPYQSCQMIASVLSTLTCATGYYAYYTTSVAITGAQCVALPTGYLTYSLTAGLLTTLTCGSGYYLVQSGQYQLNCASCGSISNVYTCLSQPAVSGGCATGYYLAYTAGNYFGNAIGTGIFACNLCGGSLASTASCVYSAANVVSAVTCNTGYYLTSFTPTSAGAASFTAATCTSCGGAAFTSCTSSCTGLATCSSGTIASVVCATGYYQATTTTCVTCNTSPLANAYSCSSLTSFVCSNGYYISSSATLTCTACSGSPTTCPSGCLTSGWYQPAGTSTTCTVCPGTGVSQCTQSSTSAPVIIVACAPTYYLVVASNSVSQLCALVSSVNNIATSATITPTLMPSFSVSTSTIPYLDQYSNIASTSQFFCQSGYGVQWSLTTNVPSCVACSAGSSACPYQCVGYANTTNSAGTSVNGCVQCSNSNTVACMSLLTTVSFLCLNGYYVNGNGTCSSCPPNTFNPSSTTPAQVTCKIGAALSVCASKYSYQLGACVACGALGTACNGTCTTSGFFTQSTTSGTTTTQTCVACSDTNAVSCQIASVSTVCNTGYYLNQASVCTLCQSGSSNIYLCPVAVLATVCNVGYLFQNGACVACPSNFATCSSSVTGTLCMPGYYLASTSATTCTLCMAGSLYCNSASTVQACMSGYYPTSTNGTDGFDVTCKLCNETTSSAQFASCASSSYAYSCKAGYYVTTSNGCAGCPTNGLTCQNGQLSVCAATYYVNSTLNTCQSCGNGASSCTNSTFATLCLTGYAQAMNGTCWSCQVVSGCATCQISSSTQQVVCTNCTGTATLSQGQCTCLVGQYQSGSGCSSCGQNCGACSNANTCSSCNSGYTASSSSNSCYQQCTSSQYQNGLACSNCPTNCTTNCSSSTVCKSGSCSSGYKYQSSTQTCTQNNSILLSILIIITIVLLF